MPISVHASGLVVGYSAEPVCAPVDLAVGQGEILALIGANGTGKSTVLRTVLGLLAPLAGQVSVLGEQVDERSAAFRADVAAVLDEDAYFPGLTAAEHLVLTASGHGVRGAAGTVGAVLERFGLGGQADVLPQALSSGQRRRLLLAAAFVRPRRVLVLDEPEQRLDTAMRAELAAMLRAEAADGVAVLLATHSADFLAALGAGAVLIGDTSCPLLGPADAVAELSRQPR